MAETWNVYRDIEKRTGGDIYIGVVGPVRTGKSTFIKKFMEQLVLPGVAGDAGERMRDELPQSAEGKTVMTTEPKFVPSRAAEVSLSEGEATAKARVRLIDCVGYAVEGAAGFEEDGAPRLINTPWSDSPMPFEKAAELGTEKVIREHATIGVLVTTDGSFTGIPRERYLPAEERTVKELLSLGKPFLILLNTASPDSHDALSLAAELEKKYGVSVLPVCCATLKEEDIRAVLQKVLFEFPVTSVDFSVPGWMQVLPEESLLIAEIERRVRATACKVNKMKDCSLFDDCFADSEYIAPPLSCQMNLGDGSATISLSAKEGVFYKILSEQCGEEIGDDCRLMSYVKELSLAKKSYEKFRLAFEEAEATGYGAVPPDQAEIALEEPKLIRRGDSCGVSIKAGAAGYHIVKIDVKGEFSPMVGTGAQGESFAESMIADFKEDAEKLLETNMFGRTLRNLVGEGLNDKMNAMPKTVQGKMRRTLTRIVNEGKGGVICILL